MGWQAWLTAATILGMFIALVRGLAAPELIVLTALALLCAVGVISPGEAVAGFGNEGLMTVALMFVLVTGLSQTGAMGRLVKPFLGQPKGETNARIRLMAPVTVLSAFLNNTPLVAMFMPVVDDWSRRTGIAPSKLFMPLSFAAILGGTCTLIGTSTNLVVQGLLTADGGAGLSMLDPAWVGIPCAIVGLTWCVVAGRWLLPTRQSALANHIDPREYAVEMQVDSGSPLVGESIEGAGLRHLPGLYLAEIQRQGHTLAAVAPTERLEANDRLLFVGVVDSVKDLRNVRGLRPVGSQGTAPPVRTEERCLVEAVVSDASPMIGQTVRESRFRSQYNAAIVAVARNGERIVGTKIGDIQLRPGDTLLLDARPDFLVQHRNSRVFYLVSEVEGSRPLRHDHANIALAILIGMVTLASLGVTSMLQAALVGAVLMLLTGCCTVDEARKSLDVTVLVVIGAAFGLGLAIDQTGLGRQVAEGLVGAVGTTPMLALASVYGLTMVFNAFISNNAAAALMFPIAKATAAALGVDLLPFAVAIMMAGSNDFATPIGYQTNLMVYGPGGYRFMDYVKFGGPLNLLMFAVSMIVIPLVWGF